MQRLFSIRRVVANARPAPADLRRQARWLIPLLAFDLVLGVWDVQARPLFPARAALPPPPPAVGPAAIIAEFDDDRAHYHHWQYRLGRYTVNGLPADEDGPPGRVEIFDGDRLLCAAEGYRFTIPMDGAEFGSAGSGPTRR